jgi:hypothetical protein
MQDFAKVHNEISIAGSMNLNKKMGMIFFGDGKGVSGRSKFK